MKISVCSDFHLGFNWDSERREDSFKNARESIERSMDSNVILLPGDLFDTRIPKQEVLSKAADIFSMPLLTSDSGMEIVETDKKEIPELAMEGIPLIAIHGTHERRSKDFTNPIQLLEKMGYLIHLHGEYIVLKNKEGERIAVHGLSGVPERYAKDALKKMSPRPVEGAYNVLMLHQSIHGYVYSESKEEILNIEDLPEGFDLIIDGHIHWYNLDDKEKNKNLIFPGSTLTTQIRKVEAEKQKGFLKLDTKSGELEFHGLKSAREVFYEDVDVSDLSSQEARKKVDSRIKSVLDKDLDLNPLLRIIIRGDEPLRISKNDIRKKYEDKAIITIKRDFKSESRRERAFKEFEKERKSVEEVGVEMLSEKVSENHNLNAEVNFNSEDLFALLAEGENKEAIEVLKQGIKRGSKEKKAESNENKGEQRSNKGTLNSFLDE